MVNKAIVVDYELLENRNLNVVFSPLFGFAGSPKICIEIAGPDLVL